MSKIKLKSTKKISFTASDAIKAMAAKKQLCAMYENVNINDADIIVALGGDGFMLQILRANVGNGKLIYGMNRGTIGFLMNEYDSKNLIERLENSQSFNLHPLRMRAQDVDGKITEAIAINEVSLFRETRQAAKIDIKVDGIFRLKNLICDGILVATSAGSTAYNLSAHGPIVPFGAGVLAMTPISPFRPRRWRGALLPHKSKIDFIVNEHGKRPLSAVADDTEVRNVKYISIEEDRNTSVGILFDAKHNLEERILKEQFTA